MTDNFLLKNFFSGGLFAKIVMLLLMIFIISNNILPTSIKHIQILYSGASATGVVKTITAREGTCGTKSGRHDCTDFFAIIEFEVAFKKYQTSMWIESKKGHNADAITKPGDTLPITYYSKNPSNAKKDSFFDIWGIILSFIVIGGLCILTLAFIIRAITK